MSQACGSVCLNASPEEVFAWLADPNLVLRWVPQMIANEHSTTPSRLGTTFVQRFQYDNRTWTSTGTIVDFVANERLAIDVQQPLLIVHAVYTLQRVDAGTVVQQAVKFEWTGVVAYLRWLIEPIIVHIARRRIATNLAALKMTVEQNRG